MQVVLDHLAALIVVSVLVVIFALLQMRGVQSASETTVNYMVRTATLDFVNMLEKDITNMRTLAQTNDAIALGVFTPAAAAFGCNTTASGDTTTAFTFVTLTNPQAPIDTANPAATPVNLVTYQLVREPGASVSRQMVGGTVDHPLYRLQRVVDGVVTGGTQPLVTFFDIEFAQRGLGTFIPTSSVACPTDLARIRFQIQMAQQGIDDLTPDQAATSQLNVSRHGSTIDLPNWE